VPANSIATRPALFLDRDGVVNHELGYIYRPDEISWLPGIFSLCRAARARGYALIVITNQSGIGRGFYSESDFHSLMSWMQSEFAAQGAPLDAYYFCPHHPDHGLEKYRHECSDRKPAPGMLLRAAREHNLNLAQSVLAGDRCSDVAAGNAAHLKKVFLLAGTEPNACPGPHATVTSLAEIEQWLTQNQ
jgi:D-glycero-D-manno-heptose 1,7-bisphosphate phosphatase